MLIPILYLNKGTEVTSTQINVSKKKDMCLLLDEIERKHLLVLKLLREDIVVRDLLKEVGADDDRIRLALQRCLILRPSDNPSNILSYQASLI